MLIFYDPKEGTEKIKEFKEVINNLFKEGVNFNDKNHV